MRGIRTVHDFLTVGAPTPLQHAGAVALALPETYYERIRREYAERRETMLRILAETGFEARPPAGAYYVMAGFGGLSALDDVTFAERLTAEIGVAVVPGSSFYSRPELGRRIVRFSFCKRLETLEEAGRRLRKLAGGPR
ncbi:MAG: hypothetical protein KatS3mg014_1582 [Actinomycetota bacterium]|nr:MAG: hypothetical protein KatS3mg014_1582 [Actinomycetota bacterium]